MHNWLQYCLLLCDKKPGSGSSKIKKNGDTTPPGGCPVGGTITLDRKTPKTCWRGKRGRRGEGELVFRSISPPTSFHPRAAAQCVFVSINSSPRSPHSHSRDGKPTQVFKKSKFVFKGELDRVIPCGNKACAKVYRVACVFSVPVMLQDRNIHHLPAATIILNDLKMPNSSPTLVLANFSES